MSLITATLGKIAAPERRTMGVACGAHVLHDGFTDLLYVLLPLWQAEFGLGYAESGCCVHSMSARWPASRCRPGPSPNASADRSSSDWGQRLPGSAISLPERAQGSPCSPWL